MASNSRQTSQSYLEPRGYSLLALPRDTKCTETDKMIVHVRLENINYNESGESHPNRDLELNAANNYSVRIGRGSRSGSKDLYPAEHNAWFESRVMSREHAVLKAHPDSKTITIEDVGSMHGTYLNDMKLSKYQPKHVQDESTMIFGAEVSRGPETFPPLEVDIFYSFDDHNDLVEPLEGSKSVPVDISMWSPKEKIDSSQRAPSQVSRNSFSVPDYDSEEYDSELDQPARETARNVEVVISPREVVVAESDFSNGDSFASEDDEGPIVEETWRRNFCNIFQASQDHPPAETNEKTDTPIKVVSTQSVVKSTTTYKSPPPDLQSSMTVQEARDDYVNSTDEESDYGDDISADLFDAEDLLPDGVKSSKQLDSSSLSSQSPILTSMPSKIELAAMKEPSKPTTDSAPAETTQTGNTDAPRAPSPSDAAMAKARAAPSYRPTTYQEYYFGAGNTTSSMPPSSLHNPYPVNTKQNNTQDPSCMLTCSYTPASFHNVQDTYPPCYGNASDYWSDTGCYQSYMSPLNYRFYPSLLQNTVEPAPKTLEPMPAPAPAPASSFVTLKATPRVAIEDLVDQPEPGAVKLTDSTRRVAEKTDDMHGNYSPHEMLLTKRKADLISQDLEPESATELLERTGLFIMGEDGVDIEEPEQEQDAQIVDLVIATASQPETVSFQSVNTPDDAAIGTSWADIQKLAVDARSVDEDERPKKKARSNLYKYAATAAGGIAVGALGAVAALVSLPADFFV